MTFLVLADVEYLLLKLQYHCECSLSAVYSQLRMSHELGLHEPLRGPKFRYFGCSSIQMSHVIVYDNFLKNSEIFLERVLFGPKFSVSPYDYDNEAGKYLDNLSCTWLAPFIYTMLLWQEK